jgi:hypothetical protein
MRPVETLPGMGGGGIRKNVEGVNLTMINSIRTFVTVTKMQLQVIKMKTKMYITDI